MEKVVGFSDNKISYRKYNILVYKVLESSNKTAKELAFLGENEGTTVVALSQTKGRGRKSRSFFSPEKSGVYFSIILRPTFSAEKTILITTAAAVAVSRAIEKLSHNKAQIKWVNDIFVNGKKVCGILTESAFSGDGKLLDFVVLGIGINLLTPKENFPKDIEKIAGSIFDDTDKDLREVMVKEVLDQFFSIYENIEDSDFKNEYKERLMLIGKEITYIKNGKNITAIVKDIDENCGLVVVTKSGETDIISTGEVSLGSENFAE